MICIRTIPLFPGRTQRRQVLPGGFALVVTLSLIALISIILLAYMSAMEKEWQASQSYAQGIRADQLAQGAFQRLESEFVDEIAAGSTRYGANGQQVSSVAPYIYWPKSALLMRMEAAGLPALRSGPLIKVSREGAALYTGGQLLASAAPTDASSANGRRFPVTRWNKPAFYKTWPTNVAAPDWINVTRAGAQVVPLADAANGDLTNPKFVLGRYAYAVYDVSGLLDISLAGRPYSGSDLTPAFIARKGSVALADLTQIPNGSGNLTTAQIDGIAKWRNKASAPAWQSYLTNFVPRTGGMEVYPGDNSFINRQDLIRYAQSKGFADALPCFTTFQRSLNAPAASPEQNATDLGAADNGPGNIYAYRDNADNVSSLNRNIANVRVKTGGWTRQDGTAAVTGEPLVKQRFALSRIGLLGAAGTPDATKIMQYFGLAGAGGNAPWTYNHGDPNRILTLGEVAALNREPDFFELLKAGILEGSLGRDAGAYSGSGTGPGPCSKVQAVSAVPDVQILRIGANIIDQYDTDGFPTTIYCQIFTPADSVGNYAYGIENLPYIARITELGMDATPPAFNGTVSYATVYIQPILWNPHQAPASGASVPGPTKLRVQAFGRSTARVSYYRANTGLLGTGPATDFGLTPDTGTPAGRIEFPAAQEFRNNPVPLMESMVDVSTTPAANVPGLGDPANWPTRPAAIALLPAPWSPDPTALTSPTGAARTPFFCWTPSATISFALQYQDGTTWRTYYVFNQIGREISKGFGAASINPVTKALGSTGNGDSFQTYDPRTDRFGAAIPHVSSPGALGSYTLTSGIRPTAISGRAFMLGFPSTAAGFQYSAPPSMTTSTWFYPGALTQNTATSQMRYTDPDGVLRPADGAYAGSAIPDGYPTVPGVTSGSQRPLILNRPFRSVGELGYVFRDLPYKSLDFFTETSGDTALLDLFSVNETLSTGARVNLNSAPLPVIKALLKGGLKKETDAAQLLDADTDAISNLLYNQLATSPLIHRGDLVRLLGSALTPSLSASADKANKTQREAAIRALAEVSDTRTWNLLIDIVAQTGRYAPQATDLSGGFVVNGERRYWLHVAIDRLTGKVISRQVELVVD